MNDNAYIIISENSGQNYEELILLAKNTENIIYLSSDTSNDGYLNGLGKALEAGVNRWGLPDWAFFSNSDLKIDFSQLFERINNHDISQHSGVWSCDIIAHPTLDSQNPFLSKRPSKRKIQFYLLVYSNFYSFYLYNLLAKLKKNMISSNQQTITPEEKEVYAVHGSFFSLSRKFIESVGTIRWSGFLFGEEIWFAEMAKKNGLHVVLDSNLSIIHEEHLSTSLVSVNKRRKAHFDSMKILYNEFWKE